ncbi:MAG: metal ABC transporter permease [Opitutales bacterium]|nr:metal ABC transporter permease [Opitutales bacterium]
MFLGDPILLATFSWEIFREVLFLQEYNTRTVVTSTSLLGIAAGMVGSFLLLRKRSLMGDALSHACLPGLVIAFLILVLFGGTGRNLPVLLVGAGATGLLGSAMVLWLRNHTRIKDDAGMGIVLSVFFGAGVVLLNIAQQMPGTRTAGLESFIYGQAAAMMRADFILLSVLAVAITLWCLALKKEFTLLCFDESFARSLGWPVQRLDLFLLLLIAAVTVIGMQAVGLILIIAFLIIPAAAARFWTDNLGKMLFLSAFIGGASGWVGASLSALLPRLPAGAIVVLVASSIFLFSLLFGTARGVLRRSLDQLRLRRKIGRQHLLRAVYEILEQMSPTPDDPYPRNRPVSLEKIVTRRSWNRNDVRQLLRKAEREDHLHEWNEKEVTLSESGFGEASRITRNHRLWEIFMITHADIAPSHVDRDADSVEHLLSPEMVRELEEKLGLQNIPASPHPLTREVRP